MTFLNTVRIVLAAALALYSGLLALWAGPDVEARFAPVLTHQRIEKVERRTVPLLGGNAICFDLTFVKARDALTLGASYVATDARGFVYPLEARRMTEDGVTPDGRALLHLPARPEPYRFPFCARIDDDAQPPVVIRTSFRYRTHDLWALDQPGPEAGARWPAALLREPPP